MPAECPICNQTATRVIDTEVKKGGRRRRYECDYCGPRHRWTVYFADKVTIKQESFVTGQQCPNAECLSCKIKLVDTRVIPSTGRRKRRYACQQCPARWTDHEGEPPSRGGQGHVMYNGPKLPPLRQDEVEQILIAGLVDGVTATAIARQYGRTSTAITAILRGDYHRGILPELIRANDRPTDPAAPTCPQCVHWLKAARPEIEMPEIEVERCGLRIPEQPKRGKSFAAECSAFTNRANTVFHS